jgi:nitrite reductase (cytochrome c-552)
MKALRSILLLGFAIALAGCPTKASKGAGDAGSAATPAEPARVAAPGNVSRDISREVASMERNAEMAPSPTGYGGSVPRQRSELIPELAFVYKGSPFASDYKEDRGHSWAWADLLQSRRITVKTPGSCITCKTPDVAGIYEDQGWSYAKRPLADFASEEHPPVGCASCHEPKTYKLRVVQPGFIEAAARGGIDLAGSSRAKMMVYVCAQCHAEYYLETGSNRVVHPWDSGVTPQAIYEYYQAKPSGFDADFTNPDSGVKLLKAQHPDYEEYSGGVHASAGVTCAACHMPAVTEGGKRTTSHWITSPLKRIGEACLQCHKGKNEQWVLARVRYIQDNVFGLERSAAQTIARGHDAIAGAGTARGADTARLNKARESLRKAQWLWDFVTSANSTVFHDPVLAQNTLAQAIGLANESILLAWRAAGRPVEER